MNRWAILGGYALLTASNQLLWITYAPITKESAAALHTSVANIGWLSAIFQLIYILLALPAGRWLDRRFPAALGAGAALTALGAVVRLLGASSFAWQLAGQALIALAQPLILNALTGVGTRSFPEAQRVTAVAVGSASIFVGILAATFSGPVLFAAGGLPLVLAVQAAPAVIGAVWTLLALRTPAAYPSAPGGGGLGWLLRDRLMWRLGGLLFIGFGVFISLSTWLEAILAFFRVNSVQSGDLLGVMVFAGVVGSALLPPLVAAREQRRGLIVLALTVGAVALLAVTWRHSLPWLGAWMFVAGFFLLATLPVVLEWAERHAGPERQGSAVGFLMLLGNAGGLVLVLVLQALIGGPYAPLLMLVLALGVGLPFALSLPENRRSLAADD